MKKYASIVLLVLTFIISCSEIVIAQRITVTVAGNGMPGSTGNGGPARQANISGAQYLCLDVAGNIYFVDGNTIRKVAANNGIITTIAGGGTSTADWIPATSASIAPQHMCTDAVGNIYLVTGSKIKKIDAVTNSISTFAGTGTVGYGGDGGLATGATFNGINDICSDALGNIYVVDKNNHRIRKIEFGTNIITTVAGSIACGYTGDGGIATSATLKSPTYICASPIGDIYFTDQSDVYIRKVNAVTSVISTYAGGGSIIEHCLASNVMLGPISGMTLDASGNLCFNEISCSCRRIDHFTDSVEYIGGDYATESFKDDTNSLYAWMNMQQALATDAKDNIYIADYGNNRIRKLIKLTSSPVFAYGRKQTINPCPGYPFVLNSQMAVADIDLGQTETWTIITPPVNGSISGFPATKLSNGKNKLATPSGLSYFPSPGFPGSDSFVIKVSDGISSDTVTVYVFVQSTSPAVVSGVNHICSGLTTDLSASSPDGIWSASNSTATVDAITGLVKGVAAGIDTITYNMVVPCALTTTFTVSVTLTPDAGKISGNDTVCIGATTHLTETSTGGTWVSLYPIYATIDSITGVVTGVSYCNTTFPINYRMNNSGCYSFAAKNIFVNGVASAITGPDPLCIGSSAMYSNDISGGLWTVSNSSVAVVGSGRSVLGSGITAGVDTIFYSNTNSCGTATVTKTITVNPAITAGTISGPSAVCIGSSITLGSTVPGGTWASKYYKAYPGHYPGEIIGYALGTDTIIYTVSVGSGCIAETRTFMNVDYAPDAGIITGVTNVCAGSTIVLTDDAPGGTWSVTNANATVSGLGYVAGVTGGEDTVMYTVSKVCSASAVKIITVDVPDAGIITGPSDVCVGSSVTLTKTAVGGSWGLTNSNAVYVGGGVFLGLAPGDDSVLYTVSNSCGTFIAASLITIHPRPYAGAIRGPADVHVGESITLENTANEGIWSASNANAVVSDAGIVNGMSTGADTIIYTVSNVCGTNATTFPIAVLDNIDHMTESRQLYLASAMNIFPNPASSTLNIEWSEIISGKIEMVLTDCLSRIMLTKEVSSNVEKSAKLDISDLKDGIYILEINAGTAHSNYKVIISR